MRKVSDPLKSEESSKSYRESTMSEEMKECFINYFLLPAYAGSYLFYLMSKMKEIEEDVDLYHIWLRSVRNV